MPYIDWTFFFAAWELKGRFPAILDHPQYGAAARELYDSARTLLDRIIAEQLLTARGVYGFWPAASEGDDIVVYADESRSSELLRFNMLRQQETIADGKPNLSLADFVAPSIDVRSTDYLGAFAVTAGLGADELAHSFEAAHDDYNAIMVKALADRLAEAFAAYLHAQARARVGHRTERLTPDRCDRRASPRHPARVRLSRRVPTTARSSSCSICSTRRAVGIDADRARGDDAGRERQRPVLRPSAGALLHGRTARRRPDRQLCAPEGRRGRRAERWLTSHLAYEPAG